MVFAQKWEPSPWNKREHELRKLKDAKNRREMQRKNRRRTEDQQLARDSQAWIDEYKEESLAANDDQTHADQLGHRSTKNQTKLHQIIDSRFFLHSMWLVSHG